MGLGMPQGERPFFKDHARITQVPKDAVNVEIKGVPAIAIGVGGAERYLEIPQHLQFTIRMVENEIIPALSPTSDPTPPNAPMLSTPKISSLGRQAGSGLYRDDPCVPSHSGKG
jgi:hypothetical protein